MNDKGNKVYRQSQAIPVYVTFISKILQTFSQKLAVKYAAKLFVTPLKHKMPKRELEMDKNSMQTRLRIPSINKEIILYQYGNSPKKALLVHGWSGRGTQLAKIADMLLTLGYCTYSFDAPAHGKAPGKTTNMTEFIECVLFINKKYGPFQVGLGHSLGGMTLLNSVKRGLPLQKLITIASGDKVVDIIDDFIKKIGLKPEIALKLKAHFDRKMGSDINLLSASFASKNVEIPVLVVHDEDDTDVPVSAGKEIQKNLKNAELLITKKLGHRKILGNEAVLKCIEGFIKK